MLTDYLPENPLRPLDWRWQLAAYLRQVDLRPRRRRWYDPWVRAAIKYQARLEARRTRCLTAHAAIGAAHGIWSSSPRLRHEIECRLLAGQAHDDIAARCGLRATIVEAYERLFYNVSERLGLPDYISSVINPGKTFLSGANTPEKLLKQLAYRYGPVVLDALGELLEGQALAEIDTPLARAVERLVTICSLPVTEETALAWVRAHMIVTLLEHHETSEPADPLFAHLSVRFDPPAGLLNRTRTEPASPSRSRQAAVVGAPAVPGSSSRAMREPGAGNGRSRRVALG